MCYNPITCSGRERGRTERERERTQCINCLTVAQDAKPPARKLADHLSCLALPLTAVDVDVAVDAGNVGNWFGALREPRVAVTAALSTCQVAQKFAVSVIRDAPLSAVVFITLLCVTVTCKLESRV